MKIARRTSSHFPLVICVALASLLGSIACRKPAPTGKRYEIRGKVLAVDKTTRTATIAHEDIQGFMPAMTMEFRVKDDAMLEIIGPGDQIAGTLVVDGIASWIDQLTVTKEGVADADAKPAEGLGPKLGTEVPDFRLMNQDGQQIHLGQYRGKALALTFIYTRCPLPEYCTLMSNNFHVLDNALQQSADLYAKTHLLTITIDPEYDKPEVLRSYGAAHTERYANEKFDHWEFATGTAEEVRGVATFFGMRYFHDNDTGVDEIVHSLVTAVVGPDGKVFKLYRENQWKPEEILADLKSLTASPGQ
jgi:protein SCO1/2